jgi:hypothetical protein
LNKSALLAVFCGWSLAGKSTVAGIVAAALDIRLIDIDRNIRYPVFGMPHPYPDASDELMRRDAEEMMGSYELLWHAAEIHIRLQRSVIVCCTLSREAYQTDLEGISQRNPEANLKIVRCIPQNDDQAEILRRLNNPDRSFGENCFSSVNSYEGYLRVKNRYQAIRLPHFEINTSPPHTAETCAQRALEYILT